MLMSLVGLRPEKLKTKDPTSRERAPHIKKSVTVYKYLKKEGENLVTGPKWVPDTKSEWQTDCRS
jgi:hypothetical protein